MASTGLRAPGPLGGPPAAANLTIISGTALRLTLSSLPAVPQTNSKFKFIASSTVTLRAFSQILLNFCSRRLTSQAQVARLVIKPKREGAFQ